MLVGMSLLTREHLEDWRRGRVPYLERVINCSLARPGAVAANPPILCARSESQAILDSLHALGAGTEAATALHQDRRPEA